MHIGLKTTICSLVIDMLDVVAWEVYRWSIEYIASECLFDIVVICVGWRGGQVDDQNTKTAKEGRITDLISLVPAPHQRAESEQVSFRQLQL